MISLRHKTIKLYGDLDRIKNYSNKYSLQLYFRNCIIISNHQVDVDWLILYLVTRYFNCIEGITAVLKIELK